MNTWSRRIVAPLLGAALTLAGGHAVLAGELAATTVGTLKVQRHGDHGRPVILIPGLQGGPWVWQQTIEQLQKNHVVYAVTLAGFDGMPAPADGGNLFDRADASLLLLIEQHKIDKPVLVGHSLGGTLALRFAGEHAQLISGVVAVEGLPIFPGMERVGSKQRQAMATQTRATMAAATPEQFRAQALGYMQQTGVIDPQLAARYAPMNAQRHQGHGAVHGRGPCRRFSPRPEERERADPGDRAVLRTGFHQAADAVQRGAESRVLPVPAGGRAECEGGVDLAGATFP